MERSRKSLRTSSAGFRPVSVVSDTADIVVWDVAVSVVDAVDVVGADVEAPPAEEKGFIFLLLVLALP